MLPSSGRAAKAQAFAALRHAPIQGGEPARHPAQSSSSSSLSARRRPVCESTAILLVSPFMDPVTSIYLPLREMTTFDHPSVCNFSNTCSAVTGRSPAMKAGAGACCAFAIIRPTLPASNAPRITHPMSRIMSLSFVAHGPSTGGAKRPAFKAKLNAGLGRSHVGEIDIHRREGAFVSSAPVLYGGAGRISAQLQV